MFSANKLGCKQQEQGKKKEEGYLAPRQLAQKRMGFTY